MATNYIRDIILYAAAEVDANELIRFYHLISKIPDFRASAGNMFERFVLSWLSSDPNAPLLICSPAAASDPDNPVLEIPACGMERTSFFGSYTALKKARVDQLPLCLLPTSQTFAAVDAIIYTEDSIITVQVTISNEHSAKGDGLTAIEKAIPSRIKKNRKWCHVFITDNDKNATSLRGQTLSDLPKRFSIYSGVFDIGQLTRARTSIEAFDEKRVSRSWLHANGAY